MGLGIMRAGGLGWDTTVPVTGVMLREEREVTAFEDHEREEEFLGMQRSWRAHRELKVFRA